MHSILKYYLIFSTSFLAATAIGDLYNSTSQICCNGKINPIPSSSVSTTAGYDSQNYYQCCGGQYVQINATTQICCNNDVVPIPIGYQNPSCCGSKVYDSSKSQCCNVTVVDQINGVYVSCCGDKPYNDSTQVCCYDTGKVLDKPASSCPSSVYYSCCNDRLLGPNQQCCNGVVINPSTTLVSYSYGNYSSTSYCCANGGIVQDSTKETCCDDGSIIPIAGPGSACCGGQMYNSSSQICCGTTIFPNLNYAFSCCGNSLFDYSSSTQQCCNNVIYNQTDLTCCYNYNYPVIYNKK